MMKPILLLLLNLVSLTLTVAQEQKFYGKPFLIEETTRENADKILYITVYRFNDDGRLVERWNKMSKPGKDNQFDLTRATLRYDGEHLVELTEFDKNGKQDNLLEFSFDHQGNMTRMKRTSDFKMFDFDSDIRTDSLGRIQWACTGYGDKSREHDCRETEYFGDSLLVNTQYGKDNAVKSVRTYLMNSQGDQIHYVEVNEKGDSVYVSENTFEYDPTGNWTVRNRTVISRFRGNERVSRATDTRRIVYQMEPGKKKLDEPVLQGRWADFVAGIDLEFRADGTYLAFVHGRRKDGGQWTLKSRDGEILMTGKEHREPESFGFQYDGRELKLFPPGNTGEISLVRVD